MKNIWEKLKELYEQSPMLFGLLLFLDLLIIYLVLKFLF